MRIVAGVVVLLASGSLVACGGATAGEAPATGQRSAPTFVLDRAACTTGVQPSAEAATAKEDASDLISVAEITFVDECTGLGGNWIIGRDIVSDRRFFLGAHGCRLWSSPPAGTHAVVRHRQTAAMFHTPSGACVAFDGEESVSSDQSTSGLVVFATLGDAKAFASERGWRER